MTLLSEVARSICMGGRAAASAGFTGVRGARIGHESSMSGITGVMATGARTMTYAPFKRKTTAKAKQKRHNVRMKAQTSVALCSFCGAVFAPHELLPKDKRWCTGECGIPKDLMLKQSKGHLRV